MARPRSDIAPRIIAAARKRFLADGVDGASLRRIARDAGTSIGMIYYYFPSKDDLFLGVVEDVYAGVLHDLSAALADDVGVVDSIRRMYTRIGAMTEDEFTVIRIVIREALISTTRLERVVQRFERGHLPLVMKTVLEGIRDGTFSSRVPFPVMVMAIGTLVILPQVVLRRVNEGGARLPAGELPSSEELALQMVDVLMHGIAGPGSNPSGDSGGHG